MCTRNLMGCAYFFKCRVKARAETNAEDAEEHHKGREGEQATAAAGSLRDDNKKNNGSSGLMVWFLCDAIPEVGQSVGWKIGVFALFSPTR
jgi:hypothetical protein